MSGKFEIGRATRRIGIGRILVALVLGVGALMIARHSGTLPLSRDVERALYDVRAMLTAPEADQDPRILLVTYTDDTLQRTGRRSPLDRGLLARVLRQLDPMGAKAIGIDILIDQPTPEDPALVAAMRAMRTPTFLGFARSATNEDAVLPWQESFERDFVASLAPGNVHAASIRLLTDPDGAIRSWPTPAPGDPPRLVDLLAGADAAGRRFDGSIQFRLPSDPERGLFNDVPIDTFDLGLDPAVLRNQVAGKYVLIGGNITDIDRFDTPATRLTGKQVTGLQVHATLLAQRLDGHFPARLPDPLLWALALAVVLIATVTGFADLGGWRLALAMLLELALLAGLPVLLQGGGIDTQGLPQFGWLAGWVIAYGSATAIARAVGSEERRFAQGALGRYLPRDVAQQILREPEQLSLRGERRHIYALFSDLEGFTKLTHAVTPETIAMLLNQYLDRMSAIVLAHGGTIDKFVGDAVVAFWGAPIARDNDAEMAMKAVLAMIEAGEDFRRNAPPGVPPIGRTRVGLHYGEAVVGNFGGERRIQYTALGDGMNTASRLESANKTLETRALVSQEAAERMQGPPPLRPMGRILVRGRLKPITVFEPSDAPADELAALLTRFEAGDLSVPETIEAMGNAAKDAALQKLVYRLRQIGPGGAFVID